MQLLLLLLLLPPPLLLLLLLLLFFARCPLSFPCVCSKGCGAVSKSNDHTFTSTTKDYSCSSPAMMIDRSKFQPAS